jgi:DNA-binding LacI/PurR family transcriptional regulator
MTDPSKKITIRTVAKAAGVSIATVSRTFSNAALVSPEIRARVEQAARRLNFQVQPRMRRPASAPPATGARRVAFLSSEVTHVLTDEAVSEEIWTGAHQVLSRHGVELVMDYVDGQGDLQTHPPRSLETGEVDGVLLRPIPNRAALSRIARNRKLVVLGNTFADLDLPFVGSDDVAGMNAVLNYLWELGHRRIAFVGPPTCALIYARRLKAYREFLRERGVTVDERWIRTHSNPDTWWISSEERTELCRRFLVEFLALSPAPTAIACATDSFAAGLIGEARERGLKLPEQLSITGFGNRQYSIMTHPPLTTVHVDQRAIGAWGATMLLQMIAGAFPAVQMSIRPHLIERRSCAQVVEPA